MYTHENFSRENRDDPEEEDGQLHHPLHGEESGAAHQV